MQSREDFLISLFSKNNKYIGDDGAFIDGLIYSKDAFFEDVHFKVKWMSLFEIGYKSVLVNASDAIVMNAVPKYALIVIAVPKDMANDEIKELTDGMLNCFNEYGITVVGGDTICNEKIAITVTLISTCTKPVTRSGAKKGDLVAYTGTLGSVKQDLEKLIRGEVINKDSKFIKPILHDKFFYAISDFISSSMDISDGLFLDLEKLSRSSKVGFNFYDDIPVEVGSSGEEYELLFTFSANNREKIESIAKKFNIKLNIFAEVCSGSYTTDVLNHHF